MKRASILLLVFGLLIVAVTPAFAQSFNLVGPTGSRLIRDVETDLVAFEWQPVLGATDYDLSLFKVSTNTRTPIGTVFTANVLEASCTLTECSYTPTAPQFAMIDTGEYAWTVIADLPSSDIEASNAPFYFSVNTAPIGLLSNPGFDAGTLASWKASGFAGDKLNPNRGNGGGWGLQFKGSAAENAKLTQQVKVGAYGINSDDQLLFSADYRAAKSTVKLQFMATIVYSGGLSKDKIKLNAVASASYTTLSAPAFTPDGTVKKIKVDIVHKSPNGKLWVDNVQITLAGQP